MHIIQKTLHNTVYDTIQNKVHNTVRMANQYPNTDADTDSRMDCRARQYNQYRYWYIGLVIYQYIGIFQKIGIGIGMIFKSKNRYRYG